MAEVVKAMLAIFKRWQRRWRQIYDRHKVIRYMATMSCRVAGIDNFGVILKWFALQERRRETFVPITVDHSDEPRVYYNGLHGITNS